MYFFSSCVRFPSQSVILACFCDLFHSYRFLFQAGFSQLSFSLYRYFQAFSHTSSPFSSCALFLFGQEPLLVDYWDARDRGKFLEALVTLKLVQGDLAEGLATGTAAALSSFEDLATFAK